MAEKQRVEEEAVTTVSSMEKIVGDLRSRVSALEVDLRSSIICPFERI